jgi:hypothetical protein
VYASGGFHFGLDVGATAESGLADSRSNFDGLAGEGCAGGGLTPVTATGCGTATVNEGELDFAAGTYKVGVGLPATASVGVTATGSITFGDFLGRFPNGTLDTPTRLRIRDEREDGR